MTKTATKKDVTKSKSPARIVTSSVELDGNEIMRGGHIEHMESLLGMSTLDLTCFLGKVQPKAGMHGKNGAIPLDLPYQSILTRFVLSYPKYFIKENEITYSDLLELVRDIEPDITGGDFAAYLGQNMINGSQYGQGLSKPSKTFSRVIEYVYKGIEEYGVSFWEEWKTEAEKEAKARGFERLKTVVKNKSWASEAFEEEVQRVYEKLGVKRKRQASKILQKED
ncbi:MAG: hypothetical protein IBX55_01360 [Methyloprofundus sp.]|nr:hypothetical protein [Methyloprofundus sp.]